jgi:chloramphenicol-sensitive protein RarD
MNLTTVPAPRSSSREGLLYGLAAYGLWGIVPLYFNALVEQTGKHISAPELLCQRIVWSLPFLMVLLTLTRRWPLFARCFQVRSLLGMLAVSSVLIGLNWYVYIYGIATEQVLQTSLGYFINPLVNVLLGMVFFRERLRPLQWAALALATVGVVSMTATAGELPWIALSLAGCFGAYGLLRKKAPVDGLVGLAVETSFLVPLAASYLLVLGHEGTLGSYGPVSDALLVCSGMVTALPLMCFGQAARRLRLTTLGFLQYVSPTLQFICAVVVIGEPLDAGQLVGFVWIWVGLAAFSLDSLLRLQPPLAAPASRGA